VVGTNVARWAWKSKAHVRQAMLICGAFGLQIGLGFRISSSVILEEDQERAQQE
jgi:hypothetical protein